MTRFLPILRKTEQEQTSFKPVRQVQPLHQTCGVPQCSHNALHPPESGLLLDVEKTHVCGEEEWDENFITIIIIIIVIIVVIKPEEEIIRNEAIFC